MSSLGAGFSGTSVPDRKNKPEISPNTKTTAVTAHLVGKPEGAGAFLRLGLLFLFAGFGERPRFT